MNRRRFLAGVVGVCASLLLPIDTSAQEERPPFDDSEALREWWARQSPERRKRLRERYGRYKDMPPEKQRDLQQRMGHWRQLSPERRGAVRERWKQFQKLPPERQQRIRKNMQRWRKLEPRQREQLRKRYRRYEKMSPEQRQRVRDRAQRQKNKGRQRPKNGGR